MNSALQNRLVGTIIVVALVVILLPEVLDGEKVKSSQDFIDIPPAPKSMEIEEPQAFPSEVLKANTQRQTQITNEVAVDDPAAVAALGTDAAASDQSAGTSQGNQSQAADSRTQPVNAASEPEEVDIDVQDSGFVVQLGSFRYEKNVNELIATLKQAGYRAYSRPVKTNVGVLNKVFVGPELEREKLEQALPHLQELTNLKGKITAFEVSAE